MKWPPPESFWPGKIYVELPPDADRVRFQAEVAAAAATYLQTAEVSEPFTAICDQLRGLDILTRAIDDLENTPAEQLPGHHRPPCLDQINVPALFELRNYARGVLANARYSSAKRRRQQKLYFDLIWAMQRADVELSNSDSGPGNRIFKAITDLLLPKSLTSSGVRKILHEEIKARARYARGDY
jgi:hypothetical protein